MAKKWWMEDPEQEESFSRKNPFGMSFAVDTLKRLREKFPETSLRVGNGLAPNEGALDFADALTSTGTVPPSSMKTSWGENVSTDFGPDIARLRSQKSRASQIAPKVYSSIEDRSIPVPVAAGRTRQEADSRLIAELLGLGEDQAERAGVRALPQSLGKTRLDLQPGMGGPSGAIERYLGGDTYADLMRQVLEAKLARSAGIPYVPPEERESKRKQEERAEQLWQLQYAKALRESDPMAYQEKEYMAIATRYGEQVAKDWLARKQGLPTSRELEIQAYEDQKRQMEMFRLQRAAEAEKARALGIVTPEQTQEREQAFLEAYNKMSLAEIASGGSGMVAEQAKPRLRAAFGLPPEGGAVGMSGGAGQPGQPWYLGGAMQSQEVKPPLAPPLAPQVSGGASGPGLGGGATGGAAGGEFLSPKEMQAVYDREAQLLAEGYPREQAREMAKQEVLATRSGQLAPVRPLTQKELATSVLGKLQPTFGGESVGDVVTKAYEDVARRETESPMQRWSAKHPLLSTLPSLHPFTLGASAMGWLPEHPAQRALRGELTDFTTAAPKVKEALAGPLYNLTPEEADYVIQMYQQLQR